MKPRTHEELVAMAKQSFQHDFAVLAESEIPVTLEMVKAMAEAAAHKQFEADKAALAAETEQNQAPERSSFLGRLFGK